MRPIVPFERAVAYRAHTGAGIGWMVGICAEIRVPPPSGLSIAIVPSSAASRSARPRRPLPATRVRATDAVVVDLDAQVIVEPSDPHRRLGRLGVLRDIGQGLGDDEVRGALYRRGVALRADVDRHVD